jgi:hypothetical protein
MLSNGFVKIFKSDTSRIGNYGSNVIKFRIEDLCHVFGHIKKKGTF